jgi:hypothetical protein
MLCIKSSLCIPIMMKCGRSPPYMTFYTTNTGFSLELNMAGTEMAYAESVLCTGHRVTPVTRPLLRGKSYGISSA